MTSSQRTDQSTKLELLQRIDTLEQRLNDRIDVIQQALDAQAIAAQAAAPPVPAIVNLIDNSDYNWSLDAYTTPGTTPASAGDGNYEAYNWYRQDRTLDLLVEDAASSLKSSGESTFAANEGADDDIPRWDRENGWAEIGSAGATNWDIACPLSSNIASPSQRFYFQVLASLRTGTAWPDGIRLFAELYDNTDSADGKRVLTGAAFDLTGAPYGTTGASTDQYKIIAITDYGAEIESIVLTITTANATLTAVHGNALSWASIQGVVRFDIYRKRSGTTYLIFQILDGATSYNDDGQTLKTVADFPAPGDTKGIARAVSPIFAPTATWRVFDLSIIVPPGYDQSKTTGKQWLRYGLDGATTDARQLLCDRIGLSHGWGTWTISSRDENVSVNMLGNIPTTGQTSSSQGPPSPAGGGPPDDGSGGERCATLDTMITVCDRDARHQQTLPAARVEAGMYLLGPTGRANRVIRALPGWADLIVNIKTENGAGRRCSPSDRWVTGIGDLGTGTPARRLCEGMPVLTRDPKKKTLSASPIVRYDYELGCETRIFEIANDHIYIAGDALAHNAKIVE